MTDTSVVVESAKRKIAEHGLVDANGSPVDDFEDAHGITYKDLGSGAALTYIPRKPETLRMLAMFGARTLATNEASAARNGREADGKEQVESIEARFAHMDTTGEWVDRTREGGPRWDQPTLASAAVNVLVAKKKIANTDEAKGKAYAKFVEQMAADPAKVAAIRQVEGVEAEYRKLRPSGKVQGSVDDLLAMTA
jgi:hypothetical protein